MNGHVDLAEWFARHLVLTAPSITPLAHLGHDQVCPDVARAWSTIQAGKPSHAERELRCDVWRRSLPPYPLGGRLPRGREADGTGPVV